MELTPEDYFISTTRKMIVPRSDHKDYLRMLSAELKAGYRREYKSCVRNARFLLEQDPPPGSQMAKSLARLIRRIQMFERKKLIGDL